MKADRTEESSFKTGGTLNRGSALISPEIVLLVCSHNSIEKKGCLGGGERESEREREIV